MEYAVQVLVWVCVAIFVATALMTLLALAGFLRLDRGGRSHDYFLKRLFAALIIEVVAASVAAYAGYIKGVQEPLIHTPASIVDVEARTAANEEKLKEIVARLDQAQVAKSTKPKGPRWELIRQGADCTGKDVAASAGADPDPSKCTSPTLTAICWDQQLFKNGTDPWCTYKSIVPSQCTDGSSPGRLYACNQSPR